MPSFTVYLEDTSPMLVYSERWQAGTSDDRFLDRYSQNSFMTTQNPGETMNLQFFGSSVQVVGSKRSNHGNYEVQVDGGLPLSFNGHATPEIFGESLFGASDLGPGHHFLTLKNVGNNYSDIDYVTFQDNVGVTNEQLLVNTFQAAHPSFVYWPKSSWTNYAPAGPASFGWGTSDRDASVVFTFQGNKSLSQKKELRLDITTFQAVL
ncbi:hypothetical protein NLJ89_g8848 [Agrocybe chaxingu]|uniref:Uncharacterized protein n=1 Tax=Agrocybe chaxingu TaxID=84603 RepID=A0A9W8JTK7_9AGAR|nr:hypothetical protein NLJ89_g8848 [Agrocybe chaxingu]